MSSLASSVQDVRTDDLTGDGGRMRDCDSIVFVALTAGFGLWAVVIITDRLSRTYRSRLNIEYETVLFREKRLARFVFFLIANEELVKANIMIG